MSINLRKGGSINLTKANPKLSKIYIGLGWELLSQSLDLDACLFWEPMASFYLSNILSSIITYEPPMEA